MDQQHCKRQRAAEGFCSTRERLLAQVLRAPGWRAWSKVSDVRGTFGLGPACGCARHTSSAVAVSRAAAGICLGDEAAAVHSHLVFPRICLLLLLLPLLFLLCLTLGLLLRLLLCCKKHRCHLSTRSQVPPLLRLGLVRCAAPGTAACPRLCLGHTWRPSARIWDLEEKVSLLLLLFRYRRLISTTAADCAEGLPVPVPGTATAGTARQCRLRCSCVRPACGCATAPSGSGHLRLRVEDCARVRGVQAAAELRRNLHERKAVRGHFPHQQHIKRARSVLVGWRW
jgi:hypothetical protein